MASVLLIRSYGAPNGTEGVLWPSVMIRFGPHWRNSKITWAILLMQYWTLTLKV